MRIFKYFIRLSVVILFLLFIQPDILYANETVENDQLFNAVTLQVGYSLFTGFVGTGIGLLGFAILGYDWGPIALIPPPLGYFGGISLGVFWAGEKYYNASYFTTLISGMLMTSVPISLIYLFKDELKGKNIFILPMFTVPIFTIAGSIIGYHLSRKTELKTEVSFRIVNNGDSYRNNTKIKTDNYSYYFFVNSKL